LPVAEGGRGLGIVMTSEWTIVMQAGTFLGYISFGYFADRFSHKYTYIAYLFLAALMVPVFAFVQNSSAVILAGALVGFFGTGYFSGFAIIASELFPTALRASAMGFVYNIGRVLSAASPWFIGRVSQRTGLGSALTITSAAFLIAALIATALRLPRSQIEAIGG
jgi:MFS family permease